MMSEQEREELRTLVVSAVAEAVAPLVAEAIMLRAEVRALRHEQPDRLVPIRELAARAACSTKTVYRRVNTGQLHPVKRPSGTYFTPEEADRAIREGIIP